MAESFMGVLRLTFLALISLFFFVVLQVLGKNLEQEAECKKDKVKKHQAYLAVLEGGEILGVEKDYRFPVSDQCTIGRNRENCIIIDDPFASNFHALILKKKNKFFVSDMESRNGTLLNNEPVNTDAQLKNGDIITIGNISFEFEAESKK